MGKARNPDNDAFYVLNICDELLGIPAAREHRFDWLRGDVSARTGRSMTLPVDGFWNSFNLVVEVMESQHFEPTTHFDKPDVLTVSGVHRGVQRRIYDLRKAEQVSMHGITMVAIPISAFEVRGKKIKRDRERDVDAVRAILRRARVLE